MTSPGHNVLIPSPGFPAYETLLGNIENCEIRTYDCLPERGWECDLDMMERLVDEKTSFILVVSPSRMPVQVSSVGLKLIWSWLCVAGRPTRVTHVGTICTRII